MANHTKKISVAVAALAAAAQATASVSWVDWTSSSAGSLPGGNVVGLSGSPGPIGQSDGTTWYVGGAVVPGTYAGLNPTDMIQVSPASTFTMTFSQPVVDPYLALVSVGRPSLAVTYTFLNATPTIFSAGSGWWGGSGIGAVSGSSFTGSEFSGILRLQGTFGDGSNGYPALSFSTNPDEFWHGFNVGVVPEPSTYVAGLGALSMLGLFGSRKRK